MPEPFVLTAIGGTLPPPPGSEPWNSPITLVLLLVFVIAALAALAIRIHRRLNPPDMREGDRDDD